MNLGQLIDTLRHMAPARQVRLDSSTGPGVRAVASWRGDYTQATLLTTTDDLDAPVGGFTVAHLIAELEAALAGKSYEGYKGGDYVFGRGTRVWADGWGQCFGINPVGLYVDGDSVVIACDRRDQQVGAW